MGILKEIRRVSDPDKAQIIWDGIKVMINSWTTEESQIFSIFVLILLPPSHAWISGSICSTRPTFGLFCPWQLNILSQTVRAQKQIPALPRLSRYMNRNYKLDKDTTQRLLDLAVEDNLVKLHKKVGKKEWE